MKRLLTLLLSLSVLLTAPLAFAQAGKAAPDKRAKVEQRVKQLRSRVLRKDVGLDEKKAAEVEKVLAKYEPERRKLQRESQTNRRALRDLLAKDSNDQPAYDKALKGLRASETKLRTLRDKEIDELSKLLTPKQQAKLLISIRKLQSKIRRRMKDIEGG